MGIHTDLPSFPLKSHLGEREAGMLCGLFWSLRRRYCCSGPLLLLGVAVCLFYQTLMVARNRSKPGQPAANNDLPRNRSTTTTTEESSDEELSPIADIGRLISTLETLKRDRELQEESGGQWGARSRRRAIVLMGQHVSTDTEVQLYQRVLEQLGYQVSLSRYAETSPELRAQQDGSSVWSILVCLSTSEKSCLRRVFLPRLAPQQRVNMIPVLLEAFSETSGGRCRFHTRTHLAESSLPMRPSACTPTNGKLAVSPDDTGHGRQTGSPSAQPGLVAAVSVYVLITAASPLTAFLHRSSVVRSGEEPYGHATQLQTFLLQQLGAQASHDALRHVKDVIGQVLEAALSTNQDSAGSPPRCLLCYQLMTFTLHFTGSLLPLVVKVDTDLSFAGLRDAVFEGQIARELVLEDTLRFLLPDHSGAGPPRTNAVSHAQTDRTGHKYGGCRGTHGLCLTEDELNLLLQFHTQLKTSGAFELLRPRVSTADWPLNQEPSIAESHHLPALLLTLSLHYQLKRNESYRADLTETLSNPDSDFSSLFEDRERCVDPHLRQLYTDPPLVLTPPFSPWVKTYRAEVPFDTVTVRIRPEPVSSACRVHLDEHRGPRTANYPVAVGNSRINILVTDEAVPGRDPVAMAIYTLHMYRDSRPSLPMFGDHVTCSFVQDCGLIVQPGKPCGLQPLLGSKTSSETQAPLRPCTSGDVPGRWVVPCLSCADNRTCDWREISWQPEGCYHPLLDNVQLQECMRDKKVLFIGDSTNRGMMYFLMERVNSSLEEWGKAHNMLLYGNLNQGLTHVSYSYYPQFWLEKSLRPTFQQALEQLLHRSRPLENSHQTVLVAGGVQWLNTNHIRVIRQVLERENLGNIMVVVKSLGIGFHLPVEGIHSLSLRGIQQLYHENGDILTTAKHHGYEVIDTFSMTMGRYKEFLQGRCACHFHEVEKLSRKERSGMEQSSGGSTLASAHSNTLPVDQDQWEGSNASSSSYHVRGPVNQMYSEILLSRLCPRRAPGN